MGLAAGSAAPLGGLNQYALVAYIQDPLGSFLETVRREIVPGCSLRSHVSVLPPRPIERPAEVAAAQIDGQCLVSARFRIYVTRIELFPVTNVIYLALGQGEQSLKALHDSLNREALAYDEPFPFHPHITLAQELQPDLVEHAREFATRRWAEFPHPRYFEVETITFARNHGQNTWRDLSSHNLAPR